jgi:hypothetical protein
MSKKIEIILKEVHQLWDELENLSNLSINDAGITTLPISEGAKLGIDISGKFHLLLDINTSKDKISRRLTSGISIITNEYDIEGKKRINVDIISEPRWRYAIEPFAAEVINSMKNGKIDLVVLRKIVNEHRALWAAPKEPLSIYEQRGVIAELHVIKKLSEVTGYAQITSKWTGPYRELHDIGDDEFSIEVKSYSEEPPRARISHVEQLDARMDKRLTLVGVHIISTQEGMTFPKYIDKALKMADEAGCRVTMEEKLNLAGWREEEREEYESKFKIGRIVICPIRPETPVFPPYLLDKIPSSVTKISYSLRLNDLQQINPDNNENWVAMTVNKAWENLDANNVLSDHTKQMHSLEVDDLLNLEESNWLEFKSSTWHPYQETKATIEQSRKKLQSVIIKSVASFLNSEGGTLLIGVSDPPDSNSKEILGIERDMKTRGLKNIDEYEFTLTTLLSNPLRSPIIAEYVRISFPEINNKLICRIDINPSPSPVFSSEDLFHVRNKNASKPLSIEEAIEYAKNHWNN